MKLSRKTLLLLTLTAGCSGGSSGPSAPTGVVFTLDWPDATRALPRAARSVRIQVRQKENVLAERLFLAGPDSEEQITGLPFATALTLSATAYPTEDGTGAPIASAVIAFSVLMGKLERISLALVSVISQVEVSGVTEGAHTALTATARDAAGNVVLTDPAQWEWSSSDSTLGTLTPTGPTAGFTESGFGVAVLTAREKESGKLAAFPRSICRGIPTTTAPTRATFPLSGPISSLLPIGDGRFVVAHGSTLACVSADGALLWQRSIAFSGGQISGPFGDYLAVIQPDLPALRIHRLSDGGSFWQEALRVSGPIQSDGNGLLFLPLRNSEGQQHFEARSATTGTVAWTQPLEGRGLVWASSTRLLRYSASDASYSLFHATLGNALWESRVPASSRFIAVGTGNTPLLYSASPGELRGLFLSNGVRSWSNSTRGETRGTLTPDGAQLVLFGEGQASGYSAATGARLWERSNLQATLAPLANGDLLVHPAPVSPDCVALEALRPTDGTARWSVYLPTGFTNLLPAPALALVLRNTELYGLDMTVGSYRWGLANPGTEAPVVSGSAVAVEERSASRLHLLR